MLCAFHSRNVSVLFFLWMSGRGGWGDRGWKWRARAPRSALLRCQSFPFIFSKLSDACSYDWFSKSTHYSVSCIQQGNSIFTGSFTGSPRWCTKRPTPWVGLAFASIPAAPTERQDTSRCTYATKPQGYDRCERTTTWDSWGKCPPVSSNAAVSLSSCSDGRKCLSPFLRQAAGITILLKSGYNARTNIYTSVHFPIIDSMKMIESVDKNKFRLVPPFLSPVPK